MNSPLINIHSHSFDENNLTIFQGEIGLLNKWFSLGIHPCDADSPEPLKNFLNQLNLPNCLALGEIGLDKLKGPHLKTQIQVFEKQIELSEKLNLPVIIHCVKAWNELKIIKRQLKPTQPWVFHGFSKANILEDVLSQGLFVSFGEAIIRNPKLLAASTHVPLEKLFFETDDSNVSIETIYSEFAKAKQITLQELKEIQFNNFKRVFKKWKSG
ncbi:MAG: TatD family hydrolase [Bacteroidetes bacterium]|nr:TatD family hydrolase [Bacteroidota bacterium]